MWGTGGGGAPIHPSQACGGCVNQARSQGGGGGGRGGIGRPPPQLPISKILFHPLAILFHPLAILFHPWNMWMTSHGQCPRGGGVACECPRGGCFPIFRRADDVMRTMSKGGCL